MRTESVTLRHLTAYDKHYTPYYKQYTAHNVVVFHDTATTEKGHQKSRAILYFFPRFSQLITSPPKTVSFADAEFQPGDRMLLSKDKPLEYVANDILRFEKWVKNSTIKDNYL